MYIVIQKIWEAPNGSSNYTYSSTEKQIVLTMWTSSLVCGIIILFNTQIHSLDLFQLHTANVCIA